MKSKHFRLLKVGCLLFTTVLFCNTMIQTRVGTSTTPKIKDLVYNLAAVSLAGASRCTKTQTKRPFYICPYNESVDMFISKSIISDGIWEPEMTSFFENILQKLSNVTFIDIGANIGYFTLMAAAMGHHVIAIEPIESNVRKMAKAIIMNRLGDKIQILPNAISDKQGLVKMRRSKNNQGGHRVVTNEEIAFQKNVSYVNSLRLDDVTPLVKTPDVVIKIDIEGHECRAIQESKMLFDLFNVHYVVMEWNKMTSERYRYGVACSYRNIQHVADTLSRRGYHAYDVRHNQKLDVADSIRWTHGNVYWKLET